MQNLNALIKQGDDNGILDFVSQNLTDDVLNDGGNANPPLYQIICSTSFSESQVERLVKALLKAGANPHIAVDGRSLLQAAGARGFVQVCSLLLANRVDPLAEGVASMCSAIAHPECFQLLLDAGLKTCPRGLGEQHISRRDVLGLCLTAACGEGNVAVVRLLLNKYGAEAGCLVGISYVSRMFPRATPLQITMSAKPEEEQYKIAKLLLQYGADPNDAGASNFNVLTDAIDVNAVGVVRALLEHKVPVTDGDDNDASALGRAASRNNPQVVQLLLDYGAQVDGSGPQRYGSPLYLACVSGPKCVKILLDAGADMSLRGPEGFSCLHAAADTNDIDTMRLLLSYGADPNWKDEQGRSALDNASRMMHFLSVILLLDHGADPLQTNRKAREVLDLKTWYPEWAGGDETNEGNKNMGLCLDVMTAALSKGFLWPKWTKLNHNLFPKNVRDAIFTTLLCFKRKDCIISTLPKWILPMVLEYVATRNKDNLWNRCGKSEDRMYSLPFMESVARFNTRHIISEEVQSCISECKCTKSLCGAAYEPQAFYSCDDCFMNARNPSHLGMCEACAIECHRKLGHKVYLNSIQPAFCDCGGSVKCKLFDRIAMLNTPESRKEIEDPNSEFGFLICIQAFPPMWEGMDMLEALPGDILRVRRADIGNGVNQAELHNLHGNFPLNAQFVRWANDFCIALCDHEGTAENEMSFKKGDFVLVYEPLEGKNAQGKADPWLGLRCSAQGTQEGWFEGFMVELCSRYDEDLGKKKLVAADLFLKYQEARDVGDYVKAIPLCTQSAELWLEISPPENPPRFSCSGTYAMTLREVSLCYAAVGDYNMAFEFAKRHLKAVKDNVPARQATDVLIALVSVIQYGCRAFKGEEAEAFQKEFEDIRPARHAGLGLISGINDLAIKVTLGQDDAARAAVLTFMDQARTLGLPTDDSIWTQASYWACHKSLYPPISDIAQKVADRHVSRMYDAVMKGAVYMLFDLIDAMMQKSMCVIKIQGTSVAELWGKQVVSSVTGLYEVLVTPRAVLLLQGKHMLETIHAFFRECVAELIQHGCFKEAFDVASMAVKVYSLGDCSSVSDKSVVKTIHLRVPSKEQRFTLEVVTFSEKHDGLVVHNPIEIVRSEDEDDAVVKIPDIDLEALTHDAFSLVVLRDPSGALAGLSYLTITRARLAAIRPIVSNDPFDSESRRKYQESKKRDVSGPPTRIAPKNWKTEKKTSWSVAKTVAVTTVAAVVIGGVGWWLWNKRDQTEK